MITLDIDPNSTYGLAISGGVDSMVLLDLFSRSTANFFAMHVDHGIRADSHLDASLVKRVCDELGHECFTANLQLGAGVSEAGARLARYDFFNEIIDHHSAMLVTAHHKDDERETALINSARGTGFRGLCAMRNADMYRPFLSTTKAELVTYALQNKLEWRDDETNYSDHYFRNRVRTRLVTAKRGDITKLDDVISSAHRIRIEMDGIIEQIASNVFGEKTIDRHVFLSLDTSVQSELLRWMFANNGLPVSRKSSKLILEFIKSAIPGKIYQVSGTCELLSTSDEILIKLST